MASDGMMQEFYFVIRGKNEQRRTKFLIEEGFKGFEAAIMKKMKSESKFEVEMKDEKGEWIKVEDDEDVERITNDSEIVVVYPMKHTIKLSNDNPQPASNLMKSGAVNKAPLANQIYSKPSQEKPITPKPSEKIYDLKLGIRILWIFPKRGGTSRTKWREIPSKRRRESIEKWREETQIIRYEYPPKMVKQRSLPFPRLDHLPKESKRVKILVKGKEEEQDFLLGNEAIVDELRHEAEFPDFQIMKSSFNEQLKRHIGWVLLFYVFDDQKSLGDPIESDPIIVVSNVSQLDATEFGITSIIPDKIEIGKHCSVTLKGFFDPKRKDIMKVIFDDEKKDYEYVNQETLIINSVFSDHPKEVMVYIQIDKKKSAPERLKFFTSDNA